MDKLADAIISLIGGNPAVELEILHALQDLMGRLSHPESECHASRCLSLSLSLTPVGH